MPSHPTASPASTSGSGIGRLRWMEVGALVSDRLRIDTPNQSTPRRWRTSSRRSSTTSRTLSGPPPPLASPSRRRHARRRRKTARTSTSPGSTARWRTCSRRAWSRHRRRQRRGRGRCRRTALRRRQRASRGLVILTTLKPVSVARSSTTGVGPQLRIRSFRGRRARCWRARAAARSSKLEDLSWADYSARLSRLSPSNR